MDYELKYMIAIFLIVKIAALSSEVSISEKKEKLEQVLLLLLVVCSGVLVNFRSVFGLEGLLVLHANVEELLDLYHGNKTWLCCCLSKSSIYNNHEPMESPTAEQTPRPSAKGSHRGPYLIWGPEDDGGNEMKVQSAREDEKSEKIEESPSFDVCEHKIESLESSLKWRNIQKTLRWLNRMLSSNLTGMELCRQRKIHKPRGSFLNVKTRNYDFVQSKKSFSKRKKTKQEKRLSDVRASRFPGEEKRIKRKRKYKHKSWRNLSKHETRKLKSKWKEARLGKKDFPGTSPPQLDLTTILRPNSVLFERIFLKKAKNQKSYCPESLAMNTERNCFETKRSKASQKSENSEEGRKTEGPASKLPKPKTKPWPHFVYHRVSSNFLHPELAGHSHKQSAYVAISVATPSKPEATKTT